MPTVGVEPEVIEEIVSQSLCEVASINLERKEHHTLTVLGLSLD